MPSLAKPGFSTVMSTEPGTVTMVVVPAESVRCGCAGHDDFCAFDEALSRGTDLNTNRGRLILSCRSVAGRTADENDASPAQTSGACTISDRASVTHQSIRRLSNRWISREPLRARR